MKKLHLLCNAHIDPVWLWQRKEGIAEALSTFRVAADFCEKYDGFVFNHNEALLYEWVEEHEPQLFERIKKLVKEGKWAIMGGWYLQPDCVMTSGESLFSQIELGREYFKEKFGVEPTVAMGVDAFGHSRGLVQILSKTGYDSYLFVRPNKYFNGDFIWEGFDGSRILAHGVCGGGYASLKGKALNKVNKYLEEYGAKEIGLCMWGIGNHGGGPSRIDLEALNGLISESDIEILHSTAENYVSEIDRKKLDTVKCSLAPSMVGCYTSMARIKQANRRLENRIAVTEKIMSYADMTSGVSFDKNEMTKARKALAFCQFHDVLPGSSTKEVEAESLRYFDYAEEIVDNMYTKAFFKLCAGQKKAKDGELPIVVFNPHPYPIEGVFEVEITLPNQNWNEDELTFIQAYDEDGNMLPTQTEKASCTFNLDWVKKVCFKATLCPSGISRFNCRMEVKKKDELPTVEYDPDMITVKNDRMIATISRRSGLIEYYSVDGAELVKRSGVLEIHRDNEDPWGMKVETLENYEDSFRLMSEEDVGRFLGYPDEKHSNVSIVEDGPVRMKIQAFFSYGQSTAVIEYTIPKQGIYIDVDIFMLSGEANKTVKYRLDTCFEGTPYGETAFGYEEMFADGRESVFHKWCGIRGDKNALYIVNRGIYGGSFTNRSIGLSLLRTPIYAAHPIKTRQIAPHDRFVEHIDIGERRFAFRITVEKYISKEAQSYNEAPYALSFFPSGEGDRPGSVIKTDDPNILLSSVKKTEKGYMLRLYNSSDSEKEATVMLCGNSEGIKLQFGAHEIKHVYI